jgi:hypothetical protein
MENLMGQELEVKINALAGWKNANFLYTKINNLLLYIILVISVIAI